MSPSFTANVERGRRDERKRCRAILTARVARGREIAARIVAFETDMPSPAARKFLAALPLDAEPDHPTRPTEH